MDKPQCQISPPLAFCLADLNFDMLFLHCWIMRIKIDSIPSPGWAGLHRDTKGDQSKREEFINSVLKFQLSILSPQLVYRHRSCLCSSSHVPLWNWRRRNASQEISKFVLKRRHNGCSRKVTWSWKLDQTRIHLKLDYETIVAGQVGIVFSVLSVEERTQREKKGQPKLSKEKVIPTRARLGSWAAGEGRRFRLWPCHPATYPAQITLRESGLGESRSFELSSRSA